MSLAPPPLDLLPVFNAQPGATLLLSPDWVILGASDDYLAATLTQRDTLVGQHIFDAFPDNPQAPEANAVANVRASLRQVLATKAPHEMAPQHYDVPDPAQPGRFVERHWQPRHTPVLDAQGQVQFIIQSVQDITESQVAARRLRESQADEQAARAEAEQQRQRFLEVLTQMPAYIAVYQGPDHIYQFVNPPYQSLFSHRSFLGRPFREGTPEAEALGVVALFDQVYRTGEPVYLREMEGWFDFHGTGQPVQVFLNISLHPLRDAQGCLDGVLDFTYDVSEQVRARRQVEQLNQELETRVTARTAELLTARTEAETQRARLERVFHHAPAAIAVYDGPEFVFELVNPVYQALLPGRALLGKPVREAFPEAAELPIYQVLRQVYETGRPHEEFDQLIPVAGPDGQVQNRYFNFTLQARSDAQEHINGVIGFGFETTEQVLGRQQTEADKERLRLLTDALPVLIGYLDRQHVYRFANRAYRDWFNQDPAALLGRPVREVVGEAAYQAALPRMERALAGERVDFDARMPYRDDFVKHIHTSYIPDVQAGQVVGFYTLVSDVTEQVQAREQLQQLNEELAAINQEMQATNEELNDTNTRLQRTNTDLDTFVYAASHDLKAPIANVEGLLEALREYLPTHAQEPMVPRLVGMMEGAIQRFQQTVAHLTDVTRLQHGVEPVTNDADVPAILEDVRLDLLPLLESTQTQLRLEVAACPGVRLPVKHLRSILFNLLSNAVKYRAPDRAPLVQVRAQCTAGRFVLEVQDNGLGLSAAQQGQLFTMFRRLHTHVEGSGVGLYLIKRMIELAGGTIALRSQSGVGSTFTVSLPRA